ncbi:MAG: hypothetical protein ACI9LM_005021 [Alteromonadaceae bacterium]|jgi:hypothetical protein
MNNIIEPPNTNKEETYLNKSALEKVVSDGEENKLSGKYKEPDNEQCFGFVLGYN